MLKINPNEKWKVFKDCNYFHNHAKKKQNPVNCFFSYVRCLHILSQQPYKEYKERKNEFKNLNELQRGWIMQLWKQLHRRALFASIIIVKYLVSVSVCSPHHHRVSPSHCPLSSSPLSSHLSRFCCVPTGFRLPFMKRQEIQQGNY